MKILFVVKSKTIENLGVMYLAAITKNCGAETRIVDMVEANAVAALWRPNIIGFSCMTGDQQRVKKLRNAISLRWPFAQKEPCYIVGGPHPTFFPTDFNDAGFDHIVLGEAENWMAHFFGAYLDYRTLDELPYPDRTDFPNMPIRDFISSRGCPHVCRYCFNDKWRSLYPDLPKVRTRSVTNVIKEIKNVKPRFVYFQDSCFGVSTKWLKSFCLTYAREIKAPFHCHLRPVQVTEERVDFLRHAGCVSTRMALETASDRLRALIGRPNTSNEEAVNASKILKKHGIKLMIQNMLALPTSTIEDDLATLEVNIRCQPAYAWSSIFSPFPGTALGDECKVKGWYTGDYSDITDCFFDKSVLIFSDEYKERTYVLQKIFALAVEAQCMPELEELTVEMMPQFIHRAMRKIGDRRMYGGVI